MKTLDVLRLPRAPEYEDPQHADNPLSGRKLYARFREQGVFIDVMQPYNRPWNPLAKCHPLLSGVDPARSLRVLITARNYDVVLTAFESPALLPLILRGALRFRPTIVMHDLGLSPGWKLRERILDAVIPRIDGIITLGQVQVDHIMERWKPDGLVTFSHMQIDTEFYQPAPFAAHGPILTVGDDVGRDFQTLISAIEGLRINLVAKTNQPILEREAVPCIRRIKERLDWIAWRQMFAEARFVVIPVSDTIHASGVGSLLEAMAMGKPIIVSNSAGIRDYMVADETALVVPCGDVSAMREAVIRLSSDDHLCQRLAAGARAFVEKHCSFEVVACTITNLLQQIVERRRGK